MTEFVPNISSFFQRIFSSQEAIEEFALKNHSNKGIFQRHMPILRIYSAYFLGVMIRKIPKVKIKVEKIYASHIDKIKKSGSPESPKYLYVAGELITEYEKS